MLPWATTADWLPGDSPTLLRLSPLCGYLPVGMLCCSSIRHSAPRVDRHGDAEHWQPPSVYILPVQHVDVPVSAQHTYVSVEERPSCCACHIERVSAVRPKQGATGIEIGLQLPAV